jgi:hypothetical protein
VSFTCFSDRRLAGQQARAGAPNRLGDLGAAACLDEEVAGVFTPQDE